MVELTNRFWDKVDKNGPNGCWVWTACVGKDGYGRFGYDGNTQLAHRLAYQAIIGEIPSDLQCDHICRNRACTNPDHIELVTAKVNTLRGVGISAVNARKTHCKRGHPLSGDNLYVMPRGKRQCRECHRIKSRRLNAANRDSNNAAQRARYHAHKTPEWRAQRNADARARYHAKKEAQR